MSLALLGNNGLGSAPDSNFSDTFALSVLLTFDFYTLRKDFAGEPQAWLDETKINLFSHEGAKARREEFDDLSSS